MKKILIAIPILIISYFTLPWVLIGLGIALSPNPPKPKNTYGEFPFHLVYEVDGEQFTIDDVLVCEFVGRGSDEAGGKYLKWNMSLQSGKKSQSFGSLSSLTGAYEWKRHAVIELLDNVIIRNYMGEIYCDLGSPQYYLGYNILEGYRPGTVFNSDPQIIQPDALWDQYKIRIVKVIFSQPMIGNGISIKT